MRSFFRLSLAIHAWRPSTALAVLLILSAPSSAPALALGSSFSVANVATAFPNGPVSDGALGPFAMAISGGELFVSDHQDGKLYDAGPATGLGTGPGTAVGSYGGGLAGLAYDPLTAKLYATQMSAAQVLRINADYSSSPIASSIPCPSHLAVGPGGGELYVTSICANAVYKISGLAGSPVVTSLLTLPLDGPDGIAVDSDAQKTAYVGTLSGYAFFSTNPLGPVQHVTLGFSVNGVALAPSAQGLKPYLYLNSSAGSLLRVDLNAPSADPVKVFTAGDRAEGILVDSGGCVFVTQPDSILKVMDASGACLGGPQLSMTPSPTPTPSATPTPSHTLTASLTVSPLATATVTPTWSTTPTAFPTFSGAAQFPQTDGQVFALAHSAGVVYVAGSFSHLIDAANVSYARKGLAAFDENSGAVLAWAPQLGAGTDGSAAAYAILTVGSTIYFGGHFGSVNGSVRDNAAAASAAGALLAWDPNLRMSSSPPAEFSGDPNARVFALASDGSYIYIGGQFDRINGPPNCGTGCGVFNLRRVDPTSGLITDPFSWVPVLDGGAVRALLLSGTTLYAAGEFHSTGVGGQRQGLAAISTVDASFSSLNLPLQWVDTAQALPVGGYALAPAANGAIWLGGRFNRLGNRNVNGIALIDPSSTGTVLPFDAGALSPASAGINALLPNGAALYSGGSFNALNGQARQELGLIDTFAGLPLPWAPLVVSAGTPSLTGPGGEVRTLLQSGSRLFAGGGFVTVDGAPRANLVALDMLAFVPSPTFSTTATPVPASTATPTVTPTTAPLCPSSQNFAALSNGGTCSMPSINDEDLNTYDGGGPLLALPAVYFVTFNIPHQIDTVDVLTSGPADAQSFREWHLYAYLDPSNPYVYTEVANYLPGPPATNTPVLSNPPPTPTFSNTATPNFGSSYLVQQSAPLFRRVTATRWRFEAWCIAGSQNVLRFNELRLNGCTDLSVYSATSTPTVTQTPSITTTLTSTRTSTASPTRSITPTLTATPTLSASPTATPSSSATPTATRTFTASPSATSSTSISPTRTGTPTLTATSSVTRTQTQTATVTPSLSTTPTRSRTPTASPSGTMTQTPSACAFDLVYDNNYSSTASDTLGFFLKVINSSSSPLNLANVAMRYYFAREGTSPLVANVDAGNIMPAGTDVTSFIQTSFVPTTVGTPPQTHYLLITFASNAGFIPAGGTVDAHIRIHTSTWETMDQSNDLGWSSSGSGYQSNTDIPGYCGGALVSGIDPGLPTFTTTATSTRTMTPSATQTSTGTPTRTASPTPTMTVTITAAPTCGVTQNLDAVEGQPADGYNNGSTTDLNLLGPSLTTPGSFITKTLGGPRWISQAKFYARAFNSSGVETVNSFLVSNSTIQYNANPNLAVNNPSDWVTVATNFANGSGNPMTYTYTFAPILAQRWRISIDGLGGGPGLTVYGTEFELYGCASLNSTSATPTMTATPTRSISATSTVTVTAAPTCGITLNLDRTEGQPADGYNNGNTTDLNLLGTSLTDPALFITKTLGGPRWIGQAKFYARAFNSSGVETVNNFLISSSTVYYNANPNLAVNNPADWVPVSTNFSNGSGNPMTYTYTFAPILAQRWRIGIDGLGGGPGLNVYGTEFELYGCASLDSTSATPTMTVTPTRTVSPSATLTLTAAPTCGITQNLSFIEGQPADGYNNGNVFDLNLLGPTFTTPQQFITRTLGGPRWISQAKFYVRAFNSSGVETFTPFLVGSSSIQYNANPNLAVNNPSDWVVVASNSANGSGNPTTYTYSFPPILAQRWRISVDSLQGGIGLTVYGTEFELDGCASLDATTATPTRSTTPTRTATPSGTSSASSSASPTGSMTATWTASPTASATPTATATATCSTTPTPTPTIAFRIDSACAAASVSGCDPYQPQLQPGFDLVSISGAQIDLSRVTIKYWFDDDGFTPENAIAVVGDPSGAKIYDSNGAQVGSLPASGIHFALQAVDPSTHMGQNWTVVATFDPLLTPVPAFGRVDLSFTLINTQGLAFTQSNDWSWNGISYDKPLYLQPWPFITGYLDILAAPAPKWGVEPVGTPPTRTFTSTVTKTVTKTGTETASPTQTGTFSPSPTPTQTPSFSTTPSVTQTGTQTPTSSLTPTLTSSGTLTPTPSQSRTSTLTPTSTITLTLTPTGTLTITLSETASASASVTSSITPTLTSSPSETITATYSMTPTPSVTDTPEPLCYANDWSAYPAGTLLTQLPGWTLENGAAPQTILWSDWNVQAMYMHAQSGFSADLGDRILTRPLQASFRVELGSLTILTVALRNSGSSADYYLVTMTNGAGSYQLSVSKVKAGSEVAVQTVDISGTNFNDVVLGLDLDGTALRVSLNGQEKLSLADSEYGSLVAAISASGLGSMVLGSTQINSAVCQVLSPTVSQTFSETPFETPSLTPTPSSTPLPQCFAEDWSTYPVGSSLNLASYPWTAFGADRNVVVSDPGLGGAAIKATPPDLSYLALVYAGKNFARPLKLSLYKGGAPGTLQIQLLAGYSLTYWDRDYDDAGDSGMQLCVHQGMGASCTFTTITLPSNPLNQHLEVSMDASSIEVDLDGQNVLTMTDSAYQSGDLEFGLYGTGFLLGRVSVDSGTCVVNPTPTPGGVEIARAGTAKILPKRLLPDGVSLVVAPNPVQGIAQIVYRVEKEAKVKMVLQDLTGSVLWQEDLGSISTGDHSHSVDLSRYANGIYFLTMLQDEGEGWHLKQHFKLAVAR